jgi:dienelactone hydrolase
VTSIALPGGAEVRFSAPAGGVGVLMMSGGRARLHPGDWGASIEWLANEVRSAVPALAVAELRYRVKSWKRFDLCVADANAALRVLAESGTQTRALVGFSMGGAVAVAAAADHPEVTHVVGLAPWMPRELDLAALEGRRFVAVHGSIDGIPGVPGTKPRASRDAVERARALGVDAEYRLIAGAPHGLARRDRRGRARPLPRARRWLDHVLDEVVVLDEKIV